MNFAEARGLILEELGRTPLVDLYKPGTRTTYDAPQVVSILLRRLPDAVGDYYRHANRLSLASIHASVDARLEERVRHVHVGAPRRRRRDAVRRRTRRDPGASPLEHPSKPILLRQVGSRWEVYLSVPTARARTRSSRGSIMRRLDAYPTDALVPVVAKDAGGYELKVGGTPARFSKADATSYAHKIGRYMLDMGDFVHTYVEERRA